MTDPKTHSQAPTRGSRLTARQVGSALPRRGNRVSHALAAGLLRLFGWRIEGEVPDVPKLVAVGAPHTSNWDLALTLATAFALGIRLSWVGKKELFWWPLGTFLGWLGGVGVNRTKPQAFLRAIIQEFNRRDKFLLAIMPEGTRREGSDWKPGFYFIARLAKVPMTLVAFDYANKVMRLGPTIYPSGDADTAVAEIKAHFANVQGKYPR